MITRVISEFLQSSATRFPVVVVTGPRQSGKTTLCRSAFPDVPYASLEPPDVRRFAADDPRGFLGQYPGGAILDEIQKAPELTSYLQPLVDERRDAHWILTGSENLALTASTSQSLAGRAAMLELLPLDAQELTGAGLLAPTIEEALWRGGYPAIFDRGIAPNRWLGSYVGTYIERDVRQLRQVGDLEAFQTFLGLCAGRAASLLNLSGLGADAGITHPTARAWLSLLEASYLAIRLQPWHQNLGKRLVKTPKLHLLDSGLLCYLLGVHAPDQLARHPQRGAVFESWVVSELVKQETHRGRAPRMWFYRDERRLEVDIVLERDGALWLIEAKSGRTVADDFFDSLRALRGAFKRKHTDVRAVLVYGGDEDQVRSGIEVRSWRRLHELAAGA